MTVFAEPVALYNVSATIICSLVYLICSHKGIMVSRFLSAPPKQTDLKDFLSSTNVRRAVSLNRKSVLRTFKYSSVYIFAVKIIRNPMLNHPG